MILFKPEHVEHILSGRKTQTRRLGQKRWNLGAVHQARTRMLDASSCFARLTIRGVWQEPLSEVGPYGAWREGYESVPAYLAAFYRINGEEPPDPVVWVVEFEAEAA